MENLIIFLIITTIIIFLFFLYCKDDTSAFIRFVNSSLRLIYQFIVLVLFPFLYIVLIRFPAQHELSVCTLITLCVIAYFVARYRKKAFSPVKELILNSLLVIGALLSLAMLIICLDSISGFAFIFCLPITILYAKVLYRRHKNYAEYLEEKEEEFIPRNSYQELAWIALTSNKKYLYLGVTSIFILVIVTAALIPFGQEPDSLISAFTETNTQWI